MNPTDFPGAMLETSETIETMSITNDEFLQTVFAAAPEGARPIVASFRGNPAHPPAGAWTGEPWITGWRFRASSNNYVSLASFLPDDAGRYRRRKVQFARLHALVFDDVGTKVAQERVTLPATWWIETSAGNFQVGYLLEEPIADGPLADRLMDAVVGAGLCDPGANGPRARLVRLPVGANGKHTPAFQCRLVRWSPDLRYSVEALVEGLQLELVPSRNSPARGATRNRGEAAPSQTSDADAIWIPRPTENAVLAALRDRGWYKAPLGQGRHDITCPWVAEHTDEADDGTAYFEPDDSWPLGGFKCHHGHCAGRHVRDLLQVLAVEVDAARMKPTIRHVAGEIHRIVDAAERELAQSRRHFQRGGLIVTVMTDPGTRETRIQELTQPALIRDLAGAANWVRYDRRSESWVRTDPPPRHATVLYDANGYAHLPVLSGLARQPYLRADGSLMGTAGYDHATGMFGVFDERSFVVPASPTRDEAEAALAVLDGLLGEFVFAKPNDRSAALAAILTATVRPSLQHAPMFHVRAHAAGSGKSYLCALISAFASPQRGTPTTFPADDEECRKLLLAELLRGPAVIEFDNLVGDLLAHKSLCTTLTSEFLTGRILGVSKMAAVSTRTLFLSSGNNVGPVQDMTRRCVTICLDPGVEIPAARTFARPELVEEVRRDRGRYVSAALTVVRAWIVAGRPMVECRALAGFQSWSDLCRQPLLWLGCEDPTVSVFEAITEDPDRELLDRVLGAWFAAFGKTAARVRDAIQKSRGCDEDSIELAEVLNDIAGERGEVNRRRLGRWLLRHSGRIVAGRRLVRAGHGGAVERWRVELVSEVSAVPPRAPQKTVATDADAYARASRGD
jgi:hypothetical protein